MIQKVRLNQKEKAFTLEKSKYTYSILESMGIITYGHEKEVMDLEESFYRLYKYSLNESTGRGVDLSTEGCIYYTKKFKEAIQEICKLVNCTADIQLKYTSSFIYAKIIFTSNDINTCGVGQLPLQINKIDYEMLQV